MLHEQEDYLDNTASWAWQQLSIGKLATVDCWAEVYVENLAGVPVWFDDLEIATGALPVAVVVQEVHYDPWGLELAGIGYNAGGNPEHDFKFQGKELVGDFGLGWYDFQWRQYDPVLGRFNSVDPMAHLMRRVSPYCYAFNNPLRFIDPDGMVPMRFNGEDPPSKASLFRALTASSTQKEITQTKEIGKQVFGGKVGVTLGLNGKIKAGDLSIGGSITALSGEVSSDLSGDAKVGMNMMSLEGSAEGGAAKVGAALKMGQAVYEKGADGNYTWTTETNGKIGNPNYLDLDVVGSTNLSENSSASLISNSELQIEVAGSAGPLSVGISTNLTKAKEFFQGVVKAAGAFFRSLFDDFTKQKFTNENTDGE